MSGPMLTKWPVLITADLAADEIDDDGRLVASAIERIGASAFAAYLDACPRLAALTTSLKITAARGRGDFGPGPVTAAAAITEIYETTLVLGARVRPAGADTAVLDITWTVTVDGGVSTELRDDLIALAHAAQHYG